MAQAASDGTARPRADRRSDPGRAVATRKCRLSSNVILAWTRRSELPRQICGVFQLESERRHDQRSLPLIQCSHGIYKPLCATSRHLHHSRFRTFRQMPGRQWRRSDPGSAASLRTTYVRPAGGYRPLPGVHPNDLERGINALAIHEMTRVAGTCGTSAVQSNRAGRLPRAVPCPRTFHKMMRRNSAHSPFLEYEDR